MRRLGGRALKTREPSLSIPCFAERRYGGVLDDEMLMALPVDGIVKALEGIAALKERLGVTPSRSTASSRTYAREWRSAIRRPDGRRRDERTAVRHAGLPTSPT